MKAFTASPWIALMLKLAGSILILTSLIDYITLFTTVNFQNSQSIITFTTGVVDRGFIPLVGLMLLFVGFWADTGTPNSSGNTDTAPMLRLTALIISSILGLFFLVLGPWHVLATRDAADNQVKQIAQEATTAETQLESQAKQAKGLGSQQLETEIAQVEQAINSGGLSGTQADQARKRLAELNKLKSDPKALESTLDAQIGPKKTEELNRIRSRKQELENQTRGTAMRAALRTGLDSVLMAIAYIILGWTGLRQMLYHRK